MYENGEKTFEGQFDGLVGLSTKLGGTFDRASPGCVWRPLGTGYQTMNGKVVTLIKLDISFIFRTLYCFVFKSVASQ